MHLPTLFSNGMVLQRRKPIPIWGSATPGATVRVQLDERADVSGEAGSDGSWTVMLPALEGATYWMWRITTDGRRLTFSNVSIGEVWLAGGQSNMEFNLEFDADRSSVFADPMGSSIRFFDVAKMSYTGQEHDHDYSVYGRWRTGETQEDLRYFSAVGYYFAETLREAEDVPIGIIGCNWGGTPGSTWADRSVLERGPGRAWVDEFERNLEDIDREDEARRFRAHPISDRSDPFGDPLMYRLMMEGISVEEERELIPTFIEKMFPTVGIQHPGRPGGLFSTMVRPTAPYAIRGVLWYQGESDAPHADLHSAVLSAVISSWRTAWNDPALPFLITQLAPFGGTPFASSELFPVLREQELAVADAIGSVWIASTSDIGADTDIHPKRKRPVGQRLAMLARRHVYGEDVTADAPRIAGIRRTDSGVEVEVEHAAQLIGDVASLNIHVVTADGTTRPAQDTALHGTTLKIQEQLPSGTEIRAGWDGYYAFDLRNQAGIPLLPFRVRVP